MKYGKCVLTVLLLLICCVKPVMGGDPVTAQELLTKTILKDQVQDLDRGEIVIISHREGELDTELAVMLAMVLPANHKRVAAVFQGQTGGDNLPGLLGSVEVTGSDGESFVELSKTVVRYTGSEQEEVERLKKLSINGDFNLSRDEYIFAESALKNRDDMASENDQLASIMIDILKGRYLAYSNGGLSALNPYSIGKNKEAAPSVELIKATEFLQRVREGHPGYYECIRNFPQCKDENITSQFFVVKQEEEGRPLFGLKHLLVELNDLHGFIMERQFYLSHSLNSLQVVIGLFPIKEKTLVVLLNQVFTEKVNVSVGKRIAKSVGRSITVKKVRPLFERLQAAFYSE